MESRPVMLKMIYSNQFGCLVIEIPESQSNNRLYLFVPHNASLSKVEELFGGISNHVESEYKSKEDGAPEMDQIMSQFQQTTNKLFTKIFMPRLVLVIINLYAYIYIKIYEWYLVPK